MRKYLAGLAILTLGTLAPAQNPIPDFFREAAASIGKSGSMNADGSFRINIPRADVKFTNASGMTIPADLGLTTYIAFSGDAKRSLAVGDMAILAGEIDGVIDALRSGGLEVVALHNHMTTEEPRLFYLHFQGVGAPAALATTFRRALNVLGTSTKPSTASKPGKPKIDAKKLDSVFGGKAQTFPSGVLRYSRPRKDIKVRVDDLPFLPGMGLASWAAFSACECGQTMAMGDTCCTRADLQSVIDAYRRAGIHITAIHNHVLGASKEVIFMHYESEGDAETVAKGIVSGWDLLSTR